MERRLTIVAHIRDILILPGLVTIVVPYFVYTPGVGEIFDSIFLVITGTIVGIAGLLLFCYTIFLFDVVGKGTLAPWTKKQKLVVTGPYQYCRNPMISGVLFILLGEALFLSSWQLLVWALIFFMVNTTYFIRFEEPNLLKQFGEEYRLYKRRVPRWLPSLKAYGSA